MPGNSADDEAIHSTNFSKAPSNSNNYLKKNRNFSSSSTDRYSINSGHPPILGNESLETVGDQYSSGGCLRYLDGPLGVLLGAIVGTILGVLLSHMDISKEISLWISLPGDLFIRALKCLVVPMVFVSLTICIGDMFSIGKVSVIGFRLAALFVSTSVIAACESSFVVYFFSKYFNHTNVSTKKSLFFQVECNGGRYLTLHENSTVQCSALSPGNSSNFEMSDISEVLSIKEVEFEQLSLSDQLIGLLKQIVPKNITKAFADASLISVIMFAIPFGIAIIHRSGGGSVPKTSTGKNALLEYLRQANKILQLLIDWVITFTPFAVISLIAGALSKNTLGVSLLENVGFLILSSSLTMIIHTTFTMPMLFYFFTKTNPYFYLRQMLQCQVFAFGCASSMATVPVTMRAVNSTKQVSRTLARLVVPVGATVNMDGSSIYIVANVIFMVFSSGIQDKFGSVEWIVLIIVAAIGSIGGAPVPNSGLIMVITVWSTVIGNDVPPSFSFVVAAEWFMDRLVTVVNVTGDCWIVRILADMVDETYMDEKDRLEDNDEV